MPDANPRSIATEPDNSASTRRGPAQGQLFEPAELARLNALARAVATDLGPVAGQWSRDTTRAELAFLSRTWPNQPKRVVVVGYVLHLMGGRGETDLTAAQIAAELGTTPAAVRQHLSLAYKEGVLEASQSRRQRHTVRRVITRGVILRNLGEFVSPGTHEPVSPGTHTLETREATSPSRAMRVRARESRHDDNRPQPAPYVAPADLDSAERARQVERVRLAKTASRPNLADVHGLIAPQPEDATDSTP